MKRSLSSVLMPVLNEHAWFGQVLSHHKLAVTVISASSLALEKDFLSWERRRVSMPAFHGLWAHSKVWALGR